MPKKPPEDSDFDNEDDVPASKNPKLQYRLPREDNCLYVPYDDKPPLLEQAQAVLGPRMRIARDGFFLDGKICNLDKIMKAANLKFRDE